ncbi:MAG TPA: hypothetical protein VGV67_01160, partial [Solirubrobacteraceae bacterium]|nr:hypothetical protein [Solirubrobacteraceae bacterium]
LRAHGVVEGEGEELELREDIAMLLGAILDCDVSLELETATAEGALGTVLHLHENMAVLQRAHDGLVSLIVLRPDEVGRVLLSLCGEDPAAGEDVPQLAGVRVSRDALIAAENGQGEAAPQLADYLATVASSTRAGRAAARGTLYGEPRAACAWVAGATGTFVLHDRGHEAEVVRADGRRLAEQLLSLVGSPN